MERDPNISRLIREGGIEKAPRDFTSRVMDQIMSAPEKKTYKPLIGKGGQLFIILLVVTVVIVTVLYGEPGTRLLEPGKVFTLPEWNLPEFQLNLQFLERFNYSGAIAATLVALFILVLTNVGLNKRRLV